jgi:hypothetical protein
MALREKTEREIMTAKVQNSSSKLFSIFVESLAFYFIDRKHREREREKIALCDFDEAISSINF